MHELSLASDVINMASLEAEKNHVGKILEIRIEVGRLSGVEAEIFTSVLDMIRHDTLLDKSKIDIVNTPGRGSCSSCGTEFEMEELYTPCPGCGNPASSITGGRDFRILSLLAE